ncbi:MAG: hypothetical protein JWR00_3538 [Rubritepida sp.]|nr:hypothetical protein [Rubritepida sp.]
MSNFKLLGVLTATAVTLGVALAGTASAATVAFTSSGIFSSTGVANPCTVGCSGNNTSFYTIGTNNGFFQPDSTLSATAFSSGSFSTDATSVRIGEIVWNNQATPSNTTDSNFNLNYLLTVNFSLPTDLAADTTTFLINVLQPTNPPGDTLVNMNVGIPNIGPFALAGVTVSNIHWVLAPGSDGSTFNSGTGAWNNPENNTATLRLVADFTATAVPVPEPASFAILGAGLLGLAAARRARRQG